jgi:hypothetical protein
MVGVTQRPSDSRLGSGPTVSPSRCRPRTQTQGKAVRRSATASACTRTPPSASTSAPGRRQAGRHPRSRPTSTRRGSRRRTAGDSAPGPYATSAARSAWAASTADGPAVSWALTNGGASRWYGTSASPGRRSGSGCGGAGFVLDKSPPGIGAGSSGRMRPNKRAFSASTLPTVRIGDPLGQEQADDCGRRSETAASIVAGSLSGQRHGWWPSASWPCAVRPARHHRARVPPSRLRAHLPALPRPCGGTCH